MNSGMSKGGAVGAVALSLAVGVALGTLVLAPNLAGGPNSGQSVAASERDSAVHERDVATAQADTADSYIEAQAPEAVKGTLADQPVLVFVSPDASPIDVDGVVSLLDAAGATHSGTIKLESKFFNRDSADALKSIVANTLPAGAQLSTKNMDAGTHAGEAMGSALMLKASDGSQQSTTQERTIILRALADAGFISYERGTIIPAKVAVFITGDSDGAGDDYIPSTQANFVRGLDERGFGAVVAGQIHSASDSGLIGLLRSNSVSADSVSTIDSVNRAYGRVATVLAVREQLEGEAGAYGSAASAEAASPAPNEAE